MSTRIIDENGVEWATACILLRINHAGETNMMCELDGALPEAVKDAFKGAAEAITMVINARMGGNLKPVVQTQVPTETARMPLNVRVECPNDLCRSTFTTAEHGIAQCPVCKNRFGVGDAAASNVKPIRRR